jgi:hypothetical protein
MVEMVHDRIAAGETTVVSTAAVLRCGKKMEIYHIITFPGLDWKGLWTCRETD